jgi:hypothetical protein
MHATNESPRIVREDGAEANRFMLDLSLKVISNGGVAIVRSADRDVGRGRHRSIAQIDGRCLMRQ